MMGFGGRRPPMEAMTVPTRLLRCLAEAGFRHAPRLAACAAGLFMLIGCLAAAPLGRPASADPRTAPGEAQSKASQRVTPRAFTDAQISEGFFKIAFGAEFNTGDRVDRVRKYDGPVRIFIADSGRADRRSQLEQVIADIRDRIDGLDIGVTQDRSAANMFISLVRDRELPSAISSVYGRDRARKIQSSLEPQCLSGFRKDDSYRIVHSDVILVVDAGEFIFRDCAYEEVLQALGPINDDASIPWTMFNDNVQLGFFGLYDQYLLNILYHPRVRPGMTREEAAAALSEILPQVRAFVATKNGLGE